MVSRIHRRRGLGDTTYIPNTGEGSSMGFDPFVSYLGQYAQDIGVAPSSSEHLRVDPYTGDYYNALTGESGNINMDSEEQFWNDYFWGPSETPAEQVTPQGTGTVGYYGTGDIQGDMFGNAEDSSNSLLGNSVANLSDFFNAMTGATKSYNPLGVSNPTPGTTVYPQSFTESNLGVQPASGDNWFSKLLNGITNGPKATSAFQSGLTNRSLPTSIPSTPAAAAGVALADALGGSQAASTLLLIGGLVLGGALLISITRG